MSASAEYIRTFFKSDGIRRLIKFSIVGGSGVGVNEVVLWLGVNYFFVGSGSRETQLLLAGIGGILVSIFTNFWLNNIWTWADRPKLGPKHLIVRISKYYLSAGIAAAVQLGIFMLFTSQFNVHYMLSSLLGIGAGMMINYFLSNYWTFRES